MASMKYHKDVKRWRVFWHVTLPNGEVDKGSKAFKEKETARQFKEHCEKRAKQLKSAVFVEDVLLEDAVAEWTGFCQGYTDRTEEHYLRATGKFIAALPDNVIYISDLRKLHINSYLNSLMSKGLKNKTVNNSMCAIKSLCKFIHENYNIANPASGIKKLKEDPAEPHFLTLDDYKEVLRNSDLITLPCTIFIANTGLRATEFCNLQWRNCDIRNKTITIVGKGRKKRTIGLNDTALSILEEKKAVRKVKPNDYVFLSLRGLKLRRDKLSGKIRKACRNSGLEGGGPHALRHFFATQLLLRGIEIIKVSLVMGHSSITTTQRHYSHILSPDLCDITRVLDTL
jgi:site-specific recombinase XerD